MTLFLSLIASGGAAGFGSLRRGTSPIDGRDYDPGAGLAERVDRSASPSRPRFTLTPHRIIQELGIGRSTCSPSVPRDERAGARREASGESGLLCARAAYRPISRPRCGARRAARSVRRISRWLGRGLAHDHRRQHPG